MPGSFDRFLRALKRTGRSEVAERALTFGSDCRWQYACLQSIGAPYAALHAASSDDDLRSEDRTED